MEAVLDVQERLGKCLCMVPCKYLKW
jgi:hypothetical protein